MAADLETLYWMIIISLLCVIFVFLIISDNSAKKLSEERVRLQRERAQREEERENKKFQEELNSAMFDVVCGKIEPDFDSALKQLCKPLFF
jgi:hypothetical protein